MSGTGTKASGPEDGFFVEDDLDETHPFVTLYCAHCGHEKKFRISCGDRTCPQCRRKWFGFHFNTLQEVVAKWPTIYSLTLTIKNLPNETFSREDVRRIRDNFGKLRKRYARKIKGGFYVVQATNHGDGWHLHLHILYDGSYIDQEDLSRAWHEITGDSYVLWLRRVKEPRRAIQYLLSDFSGKPRIRPEDRETYNRVFSGSRLVNPFGCYHATKFKKPWKCPECGGTSWVFIEDILGIPRHFSRRSGESP
jgi:hypothetical protein